jgi:hypothetical protein
MGTHWEHQNPNLQPSPKEKELRLLAACCFVSLVAKEFVFLIRVFFI